MTEHLQNAIAAATQLPEQAQDEIAQAIDDMIWKRLLEDPRSEAFFDEMHEAIEKDIADGKIYRISVLDELV
jgi:hypothetical protein